MARPVMANFDPGGSTLDSREVRFGMPLKYATGARREKTAVDTLLIFVLLRADSDEVLRSGHGFVLSWKEGVALRQAGKTLRKPALRT